MVIARPLCCCEYMDKNGSRNHILACFCNCVELDKAVDSVCCCRSERGPSCNRLTSVMLDRLRIPWLGGAKQISCDIILPMILLPSLFALGALNFPCTALAFVSIPLLVILLHRGCFRSIPKTKFFCAWTYTSLGLIFLIYEIIVVPLLEISIGENWVVIVTAALSLGALLKVQTLQDSQKSFDVENAVSNLNALKINNICNTCGILSVPRMTHCNICQKCVPKRELHCLWFGCCIGSHNLLWFLVCLLCLSINLLFSSNLILTSVCRPFHAWGTLLLPEDCSEVYYEYKFGLCFVSGLYSLMLSVVAVFALIRQCWFVSLGITVNEWRTMPLSHILRLGISAHRPYSQGLIKNWYCVFAHQTGHK